jgi:hypothetical protein
VAYSLTLKMEVIATQGLLFMVTTLRIFLYKMMFMSTIANIGTVQIFEVMSNKFNRDSVGYFR